MGRPTTTSSPARRARRGGGARARRHRGARLALVTSAALLLTLLFAAGAEAAKSGKLLYAKRIGSSTTPAHGYAVAAGPKGVTALAGMQWESGTLYPMVAKYTSAGKRVWLKRYTVVDEGWADDVAFDRNGNVYVAATVRSVTSQDIVVLKYSAAGDLLWATLPYDGEANSYDRAKELAVDARGDVVVIGESVIGESVLTGRKGIVVLKYKKSGEFAWAQPARWDPNPGDPKPAGFEAADLALDGKGDIYVAGRVSYTGGSSTALTFASMWKARGSDGAELKTWRYTPPDGVENSSFEALTVRGSSVVATGSVWPEDVDGFKNALIVKFDRRVQKKTSKEWGVGNKSEEWFNAAVIDGKGNVFVTGGQWAQSKDHRALTMKLDAKLKKVWSKTYKPVSRYAVGQYIARDRAGNIYVGGYESNSAPQLPKGFLTIKYSATGARKWARAWAPKGGSVWIPAGLVLGSTGGVYVGGWIDSMGGVYQAVLLKYRR